MKSRIAIAMLIMGVISAPSFAAHSDWGCDYCHTPHNASTLPGVPLWNGVETTTTFVMYSSDTFQGDIDGQPSGTSRLCLGCHDGANPDYLWMSSSTTFGANELQNTHPISFVYDDTLATTDGELKLTSEQSTLGGTIAQDLLDSDSKMQCTSCHDIHSSGVGEHFLRGYDYGTQDVELPDGSHTTVNYGPELCRMCHNK